MSTVGIVLAAGGGTRFGQPKATVELDGEPLAVRAAHALRDGGCDRVVVVLGAAAVDVPDADLVVTNEAWRTGMGSSLRAGLDAAALLDGQRALVLLCDQPWLGAEVVRAVLDGAPAGPDALAAATFDGRRSHPVLFGAHRWDAVRSTATGDQGARRLLETCADEVVEVPCDGRGDPADVDRPDDLADPRISGA